MSDRFLATPEALAQAVRQARAERGWSPKRFASEAGVTTALVVAVEAAQRQNDLLSVLAMLDALGIHTTALPGPEAPIDSETIDLDAVIVRFE